MENWSPQKTLLIIWLILINLISLWMYGSDKYKAKKNKWRIPENALLMSAAAGGGLGAWIGMKLFHHKTLHRQFRIIVPLALILWAALAVWLLLIQKI